MLGYILALLLAGIVIVLLYPLGRFKKIPLPTGEGAHVDKERISQSLEKEEISGTLSHLELEYAQGKLADNDYQRFKLIEERRLLSLMDSPEILPPTVMPNASPVKRPWGIILAIGIWVIAGAMAVSSLVHQKIAKDQTAASENNVSPAAGMPPINPEEMVARLKARLEKNPDDLSGQMMLGRSLMVLERWQEAEKAWEKALQLDARNPMAHSAFGETLLRSHPPGDKQIAQKALHHFDQALIAAPQEPSILWARGITLIALGRSREADESWTTAYQALTPETPEAKMVKDALEALRSGKLKP